MKGDVEAESPVNRRGALDLVHYVSGNKKLIAYSSNQQGDPVDINAL
jgi:hypothetical protein